MADHWKSAAWGGLGGAVVAVVVLLGAIRLGIVPGNDSAMHDYLMAHPAILVDMQNKLQLDQDEATRTAEQAAVNKLGMKAFFDPRVAFVTGPAHAKTSVVEFFDYNCPYCRQSVPAVRSFYEAHKDTRFAFIEFPIKGNDSTLAARAAMAARKQPDKYLAFHFLLMNEANIVDQSLLFADAQKAGLDVAKLQADMNDPGIDASLTAAHALADAAGVTGTPVFIVNGRIREGAIDSALLDKMAKS
jgi:protein-disulfide isomerase